MRELIDELLDDFENSLGQIIALGEDDRAVRFAMAHLKFLAHLAAPAGDAGLHEDIRLLELLKREIEG